MAASGDRRAGRPSHPGRACVCPVGPGNDDDDSISAAVALVAKVDDGGLAGAGRTSFNLEQVDRNDQLAQLSVAVVTWVEIRRPIPDDVADVRLAGPAVV